MTCRNQQNGCDFGKTISKLTAQDFQDAAQSPDSSTNNNVQHIVKSITIKCKCLGCTSEASQDACNDGSFWSNKFVSYNHT